MLSQERVMFFCMLPKVGAILPLVCSVQLRVEHVQLPAIFKGCYIFVIGNTWDRHTELIVEAGA